MIFEAAGAPELRKYPWRERLSRTAAPLLALISTLMLPFPATWVPMWRYAGTARSWQPGMAPTARDLVPHAVGQPLGLLDGALANQPDDRLGFAAAHVGGPPMTQEAVEDDRAGSRDHVQEVARGSDHGEGQVVGVPDVADLGGTAAARSDLRLQAVSARPGYLSHQACRAELVPDPPAAPAEHESEDRVRKRVAGPTAPPACRNAGAPLGHPPRVREDLGGHRRQVLWNPASARDAHSPR